jgi:hypothetical protein
VEEYKLVNNAILGVGLAIAVVVAQPAQAADLVGFCRDMLAGYEMCHTNRERQLDRLAKLWQGDEIRDQQVQRIREEEGNCGQGLADIWRSGCPMPGEEGESSK